MLSPILFDESDSDSSLDLSLSSPTISFSSEDSNLNLSMSSTSSTRSTRSQAPSNGPDSQSSNSSTEDYDFPQMLVNNPPNNNNQPVAIQDTDDDVVLIPEEIETIDLCTQAVAVVVPVNLHNEIIDITDSPVQIAATRPRTRLSEAREATGAQGRVPRGASRTSPYARPTTSRNVNASTPKQAPERPKIVQPLDFDDSFQSQANSIKYSCPICLESVKNREPVSTMCGHVFCKACIKAALQLAKKCPMCKKNLNSKNPFIQIFID